VRSRWERYEGPTWIVALIVYGWWAALVWFHACIPWWLIIPLGAIAIAWHNSLQHETIHALVRVPQPVRFTVAFPPLGLFVPYPIYCRSHREHHRDSRLTSPVDDPESYYHREDDWQRYSRAVRGAYLFNQTLIGRLTIGPLISLNGFFRRELRRFAAGDRSNLSTWGWHIVCVGAVLFWVGAIARMPLWQYVFCVVYPGLSLGMLRSFSEHRYAARPQHRTALVESRFPFNLLFLNNSLHLIHHLRPALPWYRIPGVWRESRTKLLDYNGRFYFAGYGAIAARHAFRPSFVPAQPHAEAAGSSARINVRPARAT
jgi:fatty acid desaturase